MKIQRKPATTLLPVPVVMVSVADGPARANIITLAWVGVVCSAPPMVGIAVRPSRYSYELLQRSHDFVVNIPRAGQAEAVDWCGNVSGRDVDKFAHCGFTPVPGSRVVAPLIDECPINLECVTRHRLSLGAHDLFVGEIVTAHYDEEAIDSRGRLVASRVDALAYVNGDYWTLGDRVGSHGFALKKAAEARKG
jgi:flavin reductase (DIM6/NTAB) family NADH-FMN oxidoreductase RutF